MPSPITATVTTPRLLRCAVAFVVNLLGHLWVRWIEVLSQRPLSCTLGLNDRPVARPIVWAEQAAPAKVLIPSTTLKMGQGQYSTAPLNRAWLGIDRKKRPKRR